MRKFFKNAIIACLLLIAASAVAQTTEKFVFEVTVIANEPFAIPLSGQLNNTDNSYDWNIDWGDGSPSEHASGTGSVNHAGILHNYNSTGIYTITITPAGSNDAWFAAFGTNSSNIGANTYSNRAMVTKLVSPLTPLMTRTQAQIDNPYGTQPDNEWAYTFAGYINLKMGDDFSFAGWDNIKTAGDGFANHMFIWSYGANFTMGDSFNMPQGFVTVGDQFAYYMFGECSDATFSMNDVFTMPQNITTAGDEFASLMFVGCSGAAFTMGAAFNMPQSMITAGDNFAEDMFEGCSGASFTMNDVFTMPQGLTAVGDFFAAGMFSGCSGGVFNMGDDFNLPTGIITVGDNFASFMFGGISMLMSAEIDLIDRTRDIITKSSVYNNGCQGSAFTMNDIFNMPQGIITIGDNFAQAMFANCSGFSLNMNDVFNLPKNITTVGNNFANYMFGGCEGISFTMNDDFTMPQGITTAGDNFANYMFGNCHGFSFKMNDVFNLPEDLTTVGDSFCRAMFTFCTNATFTMNDVFNLPQGIITEGGSFCDRMFLGSSGVAFTMNDVFNLPQGITTTNDNFASYMFSECRGNAFNMNEVFNIPQDITIVGGSFVSGMFSDCSGAIFTMNDDFNLPPDIVTMGNYYFANSMFSGCSGATFTMNDVFNLPQSITTVAQDFARDMFSGCSGASFEVNDVFTFPTLTQSELDKYGVYYQTFNNLGMASTQSRTAASIINDNPLPYNDLYTFLGSACFTDLPYIPTKWGGGGLTALFTVTFTGDDVTISPQSVPSGGYVTRPSPDPTRTNYVFGGWFTDNSTFQNAWNFDNYVITQDTTLYAKWTITFGVSVGSFSNGEVTANKAAYMQGETVTLTLANITSGYELGSIAAHKTNDVTDVPLSGTGKDNGATYTFAMPNFDVTVTATFQQTQATQDALAVAAAKTAVESGTFTVMQAVANSETDVKTWLVDQINALITSTGITVSETNITISNFMAASGGVDGGFDFTVSFTKGSANATATKSGNAISVTPVYTVTIGSMTDGSVTTNKTTAAQSETVTLTIIPDVGFELDAISAYKTGEPSTTVPLTPVSTTYTFTMPDYNVTVAASFKKTQATLDAEAVAAAKTAIEGQNFTVAQTTANSEANVKTWLASQINTLITTTGISITESHISINSFTAASGGANGSFDFTVSLTKGSAIGTAVKNGNTITATPVYTVTIESMTNGSVSADKTSALQGETVTLTITPATDYELAGITAYKTGEPTTTVTLSPAYTFSMPAYDVTVTATFTKTQAALDAEAVASAKTTIENTTYTVAQTVANTEADIKTWLTAQLNILITSTGITLTESDISINSFTAAIGGINGSFNFSVSLSKGLATVTAAKNGNTISATTVYSVTIGSMTNGNVSTDKISALPGETVTLTITPAADYELDVVTAFKTGEQTTTVTLAGTGATRTFVMPDYGVTIIAMFRKTQTTLDAEDIAAAKTAIESRSYTVAQATANTEATVKTWLVAQINDLITATTGITVAIADITLNNFTAASGGSDGAFDFVVALAKGSTNDDAAKNGNTISASAIYSITIGMTTGGNVTADASTALSGVTITLTITPDVGYELSGDISVYETGTPSNTVTFGGAGATRTFSMPAYDVTVTATFMKTQATLDAEAVATAIDAVENATYIVAQAIANDDATVRTWLAVQINALISPYSVDPITDTDINLGGSLTAASNGVDGSFNFSVPLVKGSANATATKNGNTITATPVYTVTINSMTNGSVSADKMSANQGETVTLSIIPDTDYELDAITSYMTGDPSTTVTLTASVSSTYTFLMPAFNVTVNATFKKTQASLDADDVADAKDAIENATFTVAQATANTETTVKTWLVTQINSLITSTGITVTESDLTLSNFTAASGNANGSFDVTVALSKGSTTDTAIRNGNTITATATYTVTIGTITNGSVNADKTSVITGETVTLTVTPDAGYELNTITAYHTGDLITTVTLTVSPPASYTFTMPAFDVTVTATFVKTQAALDAEDVATAKDAIENATFTVAQATANTEATVKTWLVTQINSLIASTGLTVTESDLTLTNFTAASGNTNGSFDFTVTLTKGGATTTAATTGVISTTPVYEITINSMTDGSVNADKTSAFPGETVTLTITPDSGFELTSITVYKTGEPSTTVQLTASYTFDMPAFDVTVTATFAKSQATLDTEAVEAVKTAIEGGTYRIAQATANDAPSVKTWLTNTLKVLLGQSYDIQLRSGSSQPIIGDITVTTMTPAITGTETSPNGTDGAFAYTVTLTCGATTLSTTTTSGVIIATPHAGTPVKRIELLPLGELTVRILNTGNVATGDLTVTLVGANADAFTLPASKTNSLAVGDEADITLIPRNDLPVGTYKTTLTVSGEGLPSVSVEVTFTVTPVGTDIIPTATLKTWVTNGVLHVSGLTIGETWSLYNLSGVLIYQTIATEGYASVNLSVHSTYILKSGNKTIKVLY